MTAEKVVPTTQIVKAG